MYILYVIYVYIMSVEYSVINVYLCVHVYILGWIQNQRMGGVY